MKGLLKKDAYLLFKIGKPFFLIYIVFLAVLFYSGSNISLSLFPCLMAGIFPVTLISYEERDKWQSYSALLPVSRAKLVSEKYVFTLLLLCGWFALLAVAFTVRSAFWICRWGRILCKPFWYSRRSVFACRRFCSLPFLNWGRKKRVFSIL